MPRPLPLLAAALLLAAPGVRAAPVAAVVELYQSQGCSSCPPANARANALALSRPDLLILSFAVTYWDQLGWRDTFARPEFTRRQHEFAAGFGNATVATPQFVVNGRAHFAGSAPASIDAAIARGGRLAGGPALALDAATARVGAGGGRGEVWLVRYDPRELAVPVARGENGGRTLPHRNVVRQLVRLGDWTGAARSFPLPPPPAPGLRAALLLQAGRGGPIIAAATAA
jgi:hypothetical protein